MESIFRNAIGPFHKRWSKKGGPAENPDNQAGTPYRRMSGGSRAGCMLWDEVNKYVQ
jgi:hypothetical protein